MILGHDRLLDGVHAANRRTIPVVTTVDIPRAHTLQPGDFLRRFSRRVFAAHAGRANQMAGIGAGGGKDAFKFQGSHHIRQAGIGIVVKAGRIKGFKSRRQDDRAHL